MDTNSSDNLRHFPHDRTIESKITAMGKQLSNIIRGKLSYIGKAGVLVVNIGENHANPFHIIAQTHLMHCLLSENIPFACGLEREENKVEIALQQHTRIQNKLKALDNLQKSDLFDTYQRLAAVRTGSIQHAPLTHALQLDFLRQTDVPNFFIDAERKLDGSDIVLDPKNPKNSVSFEQASRILGEEISTWQKVTNIFRTTKPLPLDSTKGMLTRNLYMLNACEEVCANLRGTKLILLFTGAAHTRGNKLTQGFSPVSHSLTHLSDNSKFDFIGVDLENDQSAHDFHLIKDKIVEVDPLSISLFDAYDIANPQNLSGAKSLSLLKDEEKKVSALNLSWLAPYKGKMFDLYAQNVMDFEEISQNLQSLDK